MTLTRLTAAVLATWGCSSGVGSPLREGNGEIETVLRDSNDRAMPLPTGVRADLAAVWSESDGAAIAVGASGVILRMRHGLWRQEESHTRESFLDIGGSGEAFAVAVGRRGTIRQFNGASWSRPEGELCISDISHVAVASPVHALAVGADGCLMHFDGQQWTIEPSPVADSFYHVQIGLVDQPVDITYAIGYRFAIQRDAGRWRVADWTRAELETLHRPGVHRLGGDHYYLMIGRELYEVEGERDELVLHAQETLNDMSGDAEGNVVVVGSTGAAYLVRAR